MRNSVGLLHLFIVGCASIAIYFVGLLQPFPLLQLYDTPHQYLGPLTDHQRPAALQYSLTIASLMLLYAVGWWLCRRTTPTWRAWTIVVGGASVSGILLLFVHPIGAGDIYDYLFTGRIITEYDANPYMTKLSQYAHDPFYEFVGWKHKRSVYGPLWQLLGIGTVRLAGPGLLAGLLAYKIVVLLAGIAALFVIRTILLRIAPAYALQGVYLFGWCPLVLIETAVNGHNDTVMVLCILLCFLALMHHRIVLALAALSCATLVKYTALMFLPLVLLSLWLEACQRSPLTGEQVASARLGPWSALVHRIRLYLPDRQSLVAQLSVTLRGAFGFTLPLIVLYAPFWEGWITLDALNDHTEMWTNSPTALLFYHYRAALGQDAAGALVLRLSLGILALTYLLIVLRQRHSGIPALIARCGTLLWVYLLVCNPWFQPWYLIWLLGFVALEPRPSLFWRAWAFALGGQASYIFFSFPFFGNVGHPQYRSPGHCGDVDICATAGGYIGESWCRLVRSSQNVDETERKGIALWL